MMMMIMAMMATKLTSNSLWSAGVVDVDPASRRRPASLTSPQLRQTPTPQPQPQPQLQPQPQQTQPQTRVTSLVFNLNLSSHHFH